MTLVKKTILMMTLSMFVGQAIASLYIPCEPTTLSTMGNSPVSVFVEKTTTTANKLSTSSLESERHQHDKHSNSSEKNPAKSDCENGQHVCKCPMGSCAATIMSKGLGLNKSFKDVHQFNSSTVLTSYLSSHLYRPPIFR